MVEIDSNDGDIVDRVLSELNDRGFSLSSPDVPSRSESSTDTSAGVNSTNSNIGQVLTVEKLEQLVGEQSKDKLSVPREVIITPAARDRAQSMGITLETQ